MRKDPSKTKESGTGRGTAGQSGNRQAVWAGERKALGHIKAKVARKRWHMCPWRDARADKNGNTA